MRRVLRHHLTAKDVHFRHSIGCQRSRWVADDTDD